MTQTKNNAAPAQGAQTAPVPTAPAPSKMLTLDGMGVQVTSLISTDFEELNKQSPLQLDLSREIEFAKQIIRKNPQLMDCLQKNPASVIESIKNTALTGLSLNPTLAESYLISRNRNIAPKGQQAQWIPECYLEPGYRGFLKILYTYEAVQHAKAEVVYKEDQFDIKLGLDGYVDHKPYLLGKRTEIIGAYSEARLPNGEKSIEWMSIDDINDVMGRNETVKKNAGKKEEDRSSTTWDTNKPEMCRKANMKRHSKYLLPHMKDPSRLEAIINLDNKVNGIDFDKERAEAKQLAQAATQQLEQNASKEKVVLATAEELATLQELSKHALLDTYKWGGLSATQVFEMAEKKFADEELQQSSVLKTIESFKTRIDWEEAEALKREQEENPLDEQDGDDQSQVTDGQ